MKELRAAVAGIRTGLESFEGKVSSEILAARAEVELLLAGLDDAIAALEPGIEASLGKARGSVAALDAELSSLLP